MRSDTHAPIIRFKSSQWLRKPISNAFILMSQTNILRPLLFVLILMLNIHKLKLEKCTNDNVIILWHSQSRGTDYTHNSMVAWSKHQWLQKTLYRNIQSSECKEMNALRRIICQAYTYLLIFLGMLPLNTVLSKSAQRFYRPRHLGRADVKGLPFITAVIHKQQKCKFQLQSRP